MPDTITKLVFSDEDYAKAAKNWSKEFLLLPILKIEDTLKYFTGMADCRYKVALPTMSANLGFGPYDPNRKSEGANNVIFRELETFLGSVITDFEPNGLIRTLLGRMAAKSGDGQKQAPSVKIVIAAVMASLADNLRSSLFTAVRNPNGTSTKDLFNGYDTIISAEIEAGKISEQLGNLYKATELISSENAVDIFKAAERACDPVLRETEKFLYCAPEYADMYNDAYLLTHNAVPYNKEFEQPILEGSAGKTTIIPLACMSGIKRAIITPKSNMLYGYDNMSDIESVSVDRFSSFMLTLAAAMFFGVGIYSIDKSRFCVVDLDYKDPEDPEEPEEPEGGQ